MENVFLILAFITQSSSNYEFKKALVFIDSNGATEDSCSKQNPGWNDSIVALEKRINALEEKINPPNLPSSSASASIEMKLFPIFSVNFIVF